MTLLDDDGNPIATYSYTGARAEGEVVEVTAGDAPKSLTKKVALLGAREGDGEAHYPDGAHYKGQFSNGKKHGTGTYTYPSPPVEEGEEARPPLGVYEGNWLKGERCGIGMMTFATGHKYHGSFQDGKYHGQGTMFYANGDIYAGEWVGGKKYGQGSYIYKESGARLTGAWAYNKPTIGTFVDKHGNAYEGAFNPMGPRRVGYSESGVATFASGATCAAPPAARLMLAASDTPDKADFMTVLKPSVVVIEYDVASATAAELVGRISAAIAANQGPFESAALACHGDGAASGFAWKISQKLVVSDAAAIDADVIEVMRALGQATVSGGRVDLFACSLLKTPEGSAVFEAIQAATAAHFAASDDLTGNAKGKGLQDWVMESDGVNVKSLYFKEETSAFEGNFSFDEIGGLPMGKGALTKEKFEEMVKEMDVNGNGTIDKGEYQRVYDAMFHGRRLEDKGGHFDKCWEQLDTDGDGNFTVNDLASFYGFMLEDNTAVGMTDDQIFEALQMQAALAKLAQKPAARPPPEKTDQEKEKAREAEKDQTIKTVMLEENKRSKNKAEDANSVKMLEAVTLGELLKKRDHKEFESVLDCLEKNVNLRVEDENGEMLLHKLPRLHGVAPETFKKVFMESIVLLREQVKRDKWPTARIASDVNHQDKQGKTPLFMAVEHKHIQMIDLLYSLVEDGPDTLLVNTAGWTVMHAGVNTDDLDTLKTLVSKFTPGRLKLLLKTQDKTGREPLHIAAYKCSEEVVKYLLDLGATNDRSDASGNTASALAIRSGRRRSSEVIGRTIEKKIDEEALTELVKIHERGRRRSEREISAEAAGA